MIPGESRHNFGADFLIDRLKGLSDDEARVLLEPLGRDYLDSDGITPLIAAISLGRLRLIHWMLEAGYPPLQHGLWCSTVGTCLNLEPLFRGLVFEMLFRRVEAYDYEEPDGYCPDLGEPILHAVARRGTCQMIELLIEKGGPHLRGVVQPFLPKTAF